MGVLPSVGRSRGSAETVEGGGEDAGDGRPRSRGATWLSVRGAAFAGPRR
jgi:hypothetical protein